MHQLPSKPACRVIHLYLDEAHVDAPGDDLCLSVVGGLATDRDLDCVDLASDSDAGPRMGCLMDEPWARELWTQPHSADRQCLRMTPEGPRWVPLGSKGKAREARRILAEAARGRRAGARLFAVLVESPRGGQEAAMQLADTTLVECVLRHLRLGAGDELHVHAEPRSDLDDPRRMNAYLRGAMAGLSQALRLPSGIPRLLAGRSQSRGGKSGRQLDVLGCGFVDHFLRALRPTLCGPREGRLRDLLQTSRGWGFEQEPLLVWTQSNVPGPGPLLQIPPRRVRDLVPHPG